MDLRHKMDNNLWRETEREEIGGGGVSECVGVGGGERERETLMRDSVMVARIPSCFSSKYVKQS